ncbi:GNAT family N-acetyltransferase [Actinomycetospora termitidis]|uniref:GNAT family N-acetyltransferase n=1 Tax=Actinomycetospora termitidis TaxID=3053470 RepID=A0ABT7M881_9PSEU|nr:GNAT family N-acetyltransferase [Actinomycetospora sp. Odt1-22]MDL5156870.1 GNAT family N-acetyltransferase [Actinomycetospora sp. Odt1-22]
MTAAPEDTHLVDLDPAELARRLDEALDLYVRAMGYPPGTARQRAPMWLEHSRRRGWRAVAAVDGADALRGIAYGYPGAPGQWWYEEVRRGLRRAARASRAPGGLFGAGLGRLLGETVPHGEDPDLDAWPLDGDPETYLADYFELTELHVRTDAQGHGLGEALLRRLLDRPEAGHVLLSTPEAPSPTRAWSLYRRCGFRDVLRHHRFSSDPRPFAVLGRPLPLVPEEPVRRAP